MGKVMNTIELAKQAGQRDYWLERFAALVEAQEREECANMCMAVPRTGAYFARLIRARGTT
jgi:hypothetical protein